MAAKYVATFGAGIAVGAALMWGVGPRLGLGPAVAPEPAGEGDEIASLTGPQGGAPPVAETAPAEPAPLPALIPASGTPVAGAPAPAIAPNGPAAGGAAAAVPVPSPADGPGAVKAVAFGKNGKAEIVMGGNAVKFFMQPPPEEVLGKELVDAARTAEPGTSAHAEAFGTLVERLANEDAARQVLDEMIAQGRVLPSQVAALEQRFRTLPEGDEQRGQLAALVARARASDDRVGEFLESLPADREPNLRIGVLHALGQADRSSPAVHAWRERMIERETDPGVLQQLLSPWGLERALNRRTAPGYVSAIERRLARGDLETAARGQALQALGRAGVHTPTAAAALARAAQDDPEEKLRNFARDAAAIVQSGEANADSIQKAWNKQYPPSTATMGGVMTFVAEVPSAPGDSDSGESEDDK